VAEAPSGRNRRIVAGYRAWGRSREPFSFLIPVERAFGSRVSGIKCKLGFATRGREQQFFNRNIENRKTDRQQYASNKDRQEQRESFFSLMCLKCHNYCQLRIFSLTLN